jgi:succinate dehydrogenase hydrophobic anchor subunit
MSLVDFTYCICVSVLVILVICFLTFLLLIANKFKPEWVTEPIERVLNKVFYFLLDLLLGKGEEVRR